jgi:diguanylate cyclase (GGDEF)-like protein
MVARSSPNFGLLEDRDDPTSVVRRRVTLAVSVLSVIACLVSWLVQPRVGITGGRAIAPLFLSVLFTVTGVLLYRKKLTSSVVWFISLLIAAIFGAYTISIALYLQQNSLGMVPFAYWMPVIYASSHFCLRFRGAIVFSIFTWLLLACGLTMAALLRTRPIDAIEFNHIIQFLMSGVMFIVIFSVYGVMRDSYQKANIQASQDSLTRLLNRRGLAPILAEHHRKGKLSVIIIDIDHFKAINDQHGHGVGDTVLQEVAFTLDNTLGNGYHIGRWGGEEFVVVLPDPIAEAQVVAERLRHTVGQARFAGLAITVSIGVTSLNTGEGLEAVLERSDQALYHAKNTGRNRVVVA